MLLSESGEKQQSDPEGWRVGCTGPREGEVPGPLGLYSERNKVHFLLDTSQILTFFNWEPWAESGTGSEAKQGEVVEDWEAKEKTGCCGKLLELDTLTSAEKFSFLYCPRLPSQSSWVRNTWCPGSGKMAVSQGVKIAVYSFTKRGNM